MCLKSLESDFYSSAESVAPQDFDQQQKQCIDQMKGRDCLIRKLSKICTMCTCQAIYRYLKLKKKSTNH